MAAIVATLIEWFTTAATWLADTIPYVGEYLAWPLEQLASLLG